ncbi:hypothetical protein KSF78_0007897 [Schistosoma japonicum]|nr:hypothetical protein KSF78_0007897 [Schistosoma japonicum]
MTDTSVKKSLGKILNVQSHIFCRP